MKADNESFDMMSPALLRTPHLEIAKVFESRVDKLKKPFPDTFLGIFMTEKKNIYAWDADKTDERAPFGESYVLK